MKLILGFLISILFFPVVSGEVQAAEISTATALNAIKLFRQDPVAVEAAGALSTVLDFADQSSAVSIDIKPEYFPWSLGSLAPQFESKFIGAFVAGNVEYQLINGVNKNTPVEGVKLILYTYEKLRKKNAYPENEKFEKWVLWKNNGELSKKLKI